MTFSQGSRSVLDYVAQTDFDTIPATPTLKRIPVKTHSLTLNRERLQGQDIVGDRQPTVDRLNVRSATGTIEVDLRKGDYDEFLESAFFGSFTSDVLKVGTAEKYLLVEDGATDIGQFRRFTSLAVSTATFRIAPQQMVEVTFDCLARDMVQDNSTISAAAATAPTGNEPFDTLSGELFVGGTSPGDKLAIVTSLEFSVQNSLAPTYVIGEDSAPAFEYGMAMVEGTMSVYYKDAALIDKFLNETETSLQVAVDDPTGTNAYTFNFPRIKFNGANVPLANPQSRVIELPFVALKNNTEGTNLILTRS